jgi:hypothetical protein
LLPHHLHQHQQLLLLLILLMLCGDVPVCAEHPDSEQASDDHWCQGQHQ